jgi:hypothetical protein
MAFCAGNGAIDVLFGIVNPSGKLPHTMPNKWNEVEMTPEQYPGTPPDTSSGAAPPCSFDPIGQDPGHIAQPKVRTPHLLRHLYIYAQKTIIIPRQARDKHREST